MFADFKISYKVFKNDNMEEILAMIIYRGKSFAALHIKEFHPHPLKTKCNIEAIAARKEISP